MDDQARGMLRYAAGVASPLRLEIRLPNGTVHDFSTESSFAILGRGEENDVSIVDPAVSYRHVYLQAIGSAVACVDLLSAAGLKWNGKASAGWLTSGNELRLGGATVRLRGDHWHEPVDLPPPLDFRPRDEQRHEYGLLPKVELELLNTSRKGAKWPINRVITLLGRDERCRITIVDDRLSRVQCAFLLLPSGLWAVDLLGKGGLQIQGQACPCGLLATGQEATIGHYQLTAHYPDAAQIAASLQMASVPAPRHELDFRTRSNKILQTDFYHDTVIVQPLGDTRAVMYHDLHMEGSRIIDLVNQRGFRNVVIDFSRIGQATHLLSEVLMAICRAAPGKSALCGADADTFTVLKSSPLLRLFRHYANCQDALQAVYVQASASAKT